MVERLASLSHSSFMQARTSTACTPLCLQLFNRPHPTLGTPATLLDFADYPLPHICPPSLLPSPTKILAVIFRVVEACLGFAVQLGALMEDILRSTRAQSAQVTQTRKDVQAAVQAMAGRGAPPVVPHAVVMY